MLLALAGGCRKDTEPRAGSGSGATPPKVSTRPPPAAIQPLVLLSTESSAYRARLLARDSAFYLLAESQVFRLAPGAAAETLPLPPSTESLPSRQGLALWRDGAVHRLNPLTGELQRAHTLRTAPRALAASEDAIGWLERSPLGVASVHSDAVRKPLYQSNGAIETVLLLGDWLFFVERQADRTWRVGGVPANGGSARFTAARPGRPPATLVAADDALYYYDGNAREVCRLSPDLQERTVLGRGGVCSPLAVHGHVYCARVEGVFELAEGEPARQIVAGGLGSLVTDIAATETHVAWVSEAGANRLEVRAVERVSK